ncbi:MAG: hypothetical protein HOF75_06675 [Flavobacteriaceae bacterium]|nr:hypothetical protein [Flavobacteriaceae bacterium]MBT3918767.1 hypothetical protein [Flavobacteriaceae bacterium]
MRYLYGLALFLTIVLWSSCRNDFDTVPNTGNLIFSQDTIYLDTVFTNIGSSTRTLKVYNSSNEDINIPTIQLSQGESSSYRLNVDGIPGKTFENINILANDSVFIFVETTIDINNFPNPDNSFLYTDKIIFDSGSNSQEVDLVTLVQDAIFLFPEQYSDGTIETLNLGTEEEPVLIEGFYLEDDQLIFTNEKPYVIYGYAAVAPNKILTVDAGARIHFHRDSGILVANTGSMKVNGTPSSNPELMENQVIFEGDRLEPGFSYVPGQWGTIWLTPGSTNHEFNYTTIKNSIVGILMEGNDGDRTLTLKNVEIFNTSSTGLLARNGNVYGENVIINNSGQTSLSCSLGGRYNFIQSTFVNYWTNNFRLFPSVVIDNVLQVSETEFVTEDLIEANFINCIIYGNEARELIFVEDESAAFNFNFVNSLIRFDDPSGNYSDDPNYDFSNENLYLNIVRNQDPSFFNTNLNDFNIESEVSGADGIADPDEAALVPFDANGISRIVPFPDAGAYQSIVFPDEG